MASTCIGLVSLYQNVIFILKNTIKLPAKFAVITACNPKGQILSATENQILNDNLKSRLAPYHVWPIIGCSPDLHHQEPSYIVVCSKQQASQLAVDYDQNALYWCDNGELFLLPAQLEFEPVAMGLFQDYLGD